MTFEILPAYQYFNSVDPVYFRELFMYRVGVISGMLFVFFLFLPFVICAFVWGKPHENR